MAKQIAAYVRLQIKAGEASPSPPVGPALGQHGVNIMSFCKAFNERTQSMKKGMPVPVRLTIYTDKNFTFEVKTPPASYLLKEEVGITSGSSRPHADKVGTVTVEQLQRVAQHKQPDLTASSLEAAVRTVAGTAKSMGLVVEDLEQSHHG